MTDDRHSPTRITRRGLLRAGGGVAAVAALGAGYGLYSANSADAAVATSKRFDLTKPSYDLFRHVKLQNQTVMQSFTFDNVNRRLFVAQLKNGSTSNANGDLCITQLDFDGNKKGYMYLKGFGHGVSIGVEAVGSASYLWTEVDSVKERGTRLARFKFSNGVTLSKASSALTKYSPVAGAVNTTCATDPVNNRIAMRYDLNGRFRIALYKLSDLKSRKFQPLTDVALPGGLGVFQGYAIYGQYVYLYTGQAYSASNPKPGNSYITCVDLNTGKQVSRALTKAGSTLTLREPEGMAVYRTKAGQTRLFLGFASGAAGDRRANLFYKNVLV